MAVRAGSQANLGFEVLSGGERDVSLFIMDKNMEVLKKFEGKQDGSWEHNFDQDDVVSLCFGKWNNVVLVVVFVVAVVFPLLQFSSAVKLKGFVKKNLGNCGICTGRKICDGSITVYPTSASRHLTSN